MHEETPLGWPAGEMLEELQRPGCFTLTQLTAAFLTIMPAMMYPTKSGLSSFAELTLDAIVGIALLVTIHLVYRYLLSQVLSSYRKRPFSKRKLTATAWSLLALSALWSVPSYLVGHWIGTLW